MINYKKLSVNKPVSLAWQGDRLIDWVRAGNSYTLDGKYEEVLISFAFSFDAAIATPDGQFAVVYQRLGTKGIVLKEGQIIRELNRSFYHSEVYEYPIAFLQLPDGEWAIVHCPNAYCQLDIELAESGRKLTNVPGRDAQDIFHSRLQIDPNNQYLIGAGWVWHPFDIFTLHSIPAVLEQPKLLDKDESVLLFQAEISSARFFGPDKIIISSFEEDYEVEEPQTLEHNEVAPNQIGVFDLPSQRFIYRVDIDFPFGNVYPINDHYIWDLYQHPKVIELTTGKIVYENEEVKTGEQRSSILMTGELPPPIAQSPDYRRLAIGFEEGIHILEWSGK